jgi:hypothetical protein
MNLIIESHRGRTGAIAQAVHWLQGNDAIRSSAAIVYAEAVSGIRFQSAGAHRLAGLCPTNLQDVLRGRLAAKIVVKTDHTMHLRAGQVQRSGDAGYGISGNKAKGILNSMQKWQQPAGHITVLLDTSLHCTRYTFIHHVLPATWSALPHYTRYAWSKVPIIIVARSNY